MSSIIPLTRENCSSWSAVVTTSARVLDLGLNDGSENEGLLAALGVTAGLSSPLGLRAPAPGDSTTSSNPNPEPSTSALALSSAATQNWACSSSSQHSAIESSLLWT